MDQLRHVAVKVVKGAHMQETEVFEVCEVAGAQLIGVLHKQKVTAQLMGQAGDLCAGGLQRLLIHRLP